MQADVFYYYYLLHWRYMNLQMSFSICENFIRFAFFIRLIHLC